MCRRPSHGLSRYRVRLSSAALLLALLSATVRSDAVERTPVGTPVVADKPAVATKPADAKPDLQLDPVFQKVVPENIADLLAIETRVKKLVAELTPCTVGVHVGAAQGSGVIVSEDGYVLTAAHVAGSPGRSVTFVLSDGRTVQGKTLGVDRGADAGLMQITEGGDWPFAKMGEMKSVKPGNWCTAFGYPGGDPRGRSLVVRLGRVVTTRKMLVQTDCTLVGGDSGGPLFDMQGRVVGIHSRIGVPTSWNFHVPISAYTKSWDRLVASEAWGGRPRRGGGAILGVRGDDAGQGCKLTEIAPGLPAEKAGFQVGDVIVKFDGKAVHGFDSLAEAVRRKKPGDKVTIQLLRGKETIEKTVTLASRQ